jgi:hypothetical protein
MDLNQPERGASLPSPAYFTNFGTVTSLVCTQRLSGKGSLG